MDDRIGQYVMRESETDGLQRALTMPHLVESIIADEPITRCGRRLRTRAGTSFRYSTTLPMRTCAGCER